MICYDMLQRLKLHILPIKAANYPILNMKYIQLENVSHILHHKGEILPEHQTSKQTIKVDSYGLIFLNTQ